MPQPAGAPARRADGAPGPRAPLVRPELKGASWTDKVRPPGSTTSPPQQDTDNIHMNYASSYALPHLCIRC